MPTYSLISSYTVPSGGVSSITFSNIPQSYTDLNILLSLKNPSGTSNENGEDMGFRLNGDSGSNYYSNLFYRTVSLGSTNTSGTSMTWVGQSNNSGSGMTNVFSNISVYISNYKSSNPKPISIDSVCESTTASFGIVIASGYWNNSAAITSMTWTPNGGTFNQFSTAYLYGISNA